MVSSNCMLMWHYSKTCFAWIFHHSVNVPFIFLSFGTASRRNLHCTYSWWLSPVLLFFRSLCDICLIGTTHLDEVEFENIRRCRQCLYKPYNAIILKLVTFKITSNFSRKWKVELICKFNVRIAEENRDFNILRFFVYRSSHVAVIVPRCCRLSSITCQYWNHISYVGRFTQSGTTHLEIRARELFEHHQHRLLLEVGCGW